ncbi:MAG: hypothetical protein ACRC8Y_16445 [Chroococcales cyanobacterium]
MHYFTPANAVTASLNLYRKRFKTYFKISLISHLWFLIPIYGWAKFLAGMALISRLAFAEINGKTETVSEAENYIKPREWNFFVAAILAFLAFMRRGFLWVLLWMVLPRMIFYFKDYVLYRDGFYGRINYLPLVDLAALIVNLFLYIGLSLKPLKIYASFFIYELPLAIEEKITSSTTVTRSRQLVEGLQPSIVKMIFIMYFTMIPIMFLSDWLRVWSLGFIQRIIYTNYHDFTYFVLEKIVWIIYWGSFNILIYPFWQTLKSMVYYHCRCQKEAFDLSLTLASSGSGDDAGDFVEMGSESSDESPEVG